MAGHVVTCSQNSTCHKDDITCPPGQPCTLNCLGYGDDYFGDACQQTLLTCADDYDCTVNCMDNYACWSMEVYCPANAICTITAAPNEQSFMMAWAQIHGGAGGTLNMLIDAQNGIASATVHCPIGGDCNFVSHGASNVWSDMTINATQSRSLSMVSTDSYLPLLSAYVYCPDENLSDSPNCVIDVSSEDESVTRFIVHPAVYVKKRSNAYFRVNAQAECTDCSIWLYFEQAQCKQMCVMDLIQGTQDEWICEIEQPCLTNGPTMQTTPAIISMTDTDQVVVGGDLPIDTEPLFVADPSDPGMIDGIWIALFGLLGSCCCLCVVLGLLLLWRKRKRKEYETRVSQSEPVAVTALPSRKTLSKKKSAGEILADESESEELMEGEHVTRGFRESRMERHLDELLERQQVGSKAREKGAPPCDECGEVKPGHKDGQSGDFYCEDCWEGWGDGSQVTRMADCAECGEYKFCAEDALDKQFRCEQCRPR